MARDILYGMLSTLSVPVPPSDEQERADMEALNLKGKPFNIEFRSAALDYGFKLFEDTVTRRPAGENRKTPDPQRFESGDLVRIFRTVSKGDILWQGAIALDPSRKYGPQKGVPIQKWAPMFIENFPAKLERDGKAVFGSLEAYYETGMEGVTWALCEYGKPGYGGLHLLENGDALTVYGNVQEGDIAWQGRLEFGPDDMTLAQEKGIIRLAKHMNMNQWLQMCSEKLPVAVIKNGAPGPS